MAGAAADVDSDGEVLVGVVVAAVVVIIAIVVIIFTVVVAVAVVFDPDQLIHLVGNLIHHPDMISVHLRNLVLVIPTTNQCQTF